MKQNILVTTKFLEAAEHLDKGAKSKLIKALNLLASDVRHPSLQTKRIQGAASEVYEARVDQSLRLVYDRISGMLRCWFVGDHDEALKRGAALHAGGGVEVDDIEIVSAGVMVECVLSDDDLQSGKPKQ